MKDDTTTVYVHKKLTGSDKYVVGATLGIYPVKKNLLGIEVTDWNNPVAVFETNGTYTTVLALPIGKYVLHEISVPKTVPAGYKAWKLGDDVKFEVTDYIDSTHPLDVIIYNTLILGDTEDKPAPTPNTPVNPTPEVIVVETVQTGDSNVILPFVFAGLALVVAGWGSILLLRKKEDDVEEDSNQDSE